MFFTESFMEEFDEHAYRDFFMETSSEEAKVMLQTEIIDPIIAVLETSKGKKEYIKLPG